MKKLLTLFVGCIFYLNGYCQENSIVGKWKVVTAETKDFLLDNTKDTIFISEKMRKLYPSKIGMQDE